MRDVKQLHPKLQKKIDKFLLKCEKAGYKVKVTECFRTVAEQDKLYAQGRITPGKKVTNARGKDYASMHQWGLAFDICRNDGKGAYYDKDRFFINVGKIGKSCGLRWGGDFTSIYDPCHFQLKGFGDTPNKKLKPYYGSPDKFIKTWKK